MPERYWNAAAVEIHMNEAAWHMAAAAPGAPDLNAESVGSGGCGRLARSGGAAVAVAAVAVAVAVAAAAFVAGGMGSRSSGAGSRARGGMAQGGMGGAVEHMDVRMAGRRGRGAGRGGGAGGRGR